MEKIEFENKVFVIEKFVQEVFFKKYQMVMFKVGIIYFVDLFGFDEQYYLILEINRFCV